MIGFVRQLVTRCAVDSGLLVATHDASASHVTAWQRTRLLTARGNEEGGKWFREKYGRMVWKLRLESSSCQRHQYWRVPRPRPKPNRRAARGRSTPIIRVALSSATANQTPAEDVIRVLQDALSKAVDRAAAAESKLKEASCRSHLSTALTDARTKYWEQRMHDMTDLASQLEDTKRKLQRSERNREKLQLAHQDELSAAVGKLDRVRKKYKAAKLSCVVCARRDAWDKHCDEEIQDLWDASGTAAFNRFKCNLHTNSYVIAHYLFTALCILDVFNRIYHLVLVLGGSSQVQRKDVK